MDEPGFFLDDQDRESFLSVLGSVVNRYNVLCHAYCLMDNHYDRLLATPDANPSAGMLSLTICQDLTPLPFLV